MRVCVCVWLSRAWNSLNGSQTVQRCFIKAGFIMTGEELIATEEFPEDTGTNELDLLALEAEIADPPMVEDHEEIINKVLEPSQANDVTVLDEEPDVVMNDCEPVHVITVEAATQALLDLEIFFQDQWKQVDTEWCAVHADEVRKVEEKHKKQTKMSQFFSLC
ncbi:hypothetical protein LOD99_1774 [Oopsacas minuta]|uniref:Uncharacterized protein n=1 Tax=Oopsacas minuta TaxID=111878 RepID=A0AAV7K4K7_9METZ|nr:hypothetical protein LOD99_1774 [Oopsacas minuta]